MEALAPVRRTTRLTAPGRIVLPVAAASLAASWAFGGVVGLFSSTAVASLLLALLLTRRHLASLCVVPPGPARVHVGDSFTPKITLVRDGGLLAARHLRLYCGEGADFGERSAGHRLAVLPGERARVPITYRLHRRGRHRELDLVVSSTFPLGLVVHRLIYRLPVDFLALPRLGSLNDLGRLPRGRRDPVPQPRPLEHGEEELYGVRDWREGESMRRVHWRLTARRGRRIVREMRLQAEPPVNLVLATQVMQVLPLEAPRRRFERSVSLVATLAEHFLRRGRSVRLTLAGSEDVRLEVARGRGGLLRLLTALAEVKFEAGDPEAAIASAIEGVPDGEVPIAVIVGDGGPRPASRALTIDVEHPDTQRIFLPGRPWGHAWGGEAPSSFASVAEGVASSEGAW